MPEDKNINISLVPKFAEKAMENILEEPSKKIGHTLSDVWYLIFGGSIELLAERKKIKYEIALQKYKREIEDEINKICVPYSQGVDLQVVGQALEASKYCIEEKELRAMFAKLIASSMDENKHGLVHPSYAEIIRQISADEAKILKYIYLNIEKEKNRFPIVDIRQIMKRDIIHNTSGSNFIKIICKENERIQTIRTSQKFNRNELGKIVCTNKTNIGEKAECIYPNNISEYLQNLERLRIVDIRDRAFISFEDYEKMINSSFMDEICLDLENVIPNNEIIICFIKKYFCVTEYGLSFMKTCI